MSGYLGLSIHSPILTQTNISFKTNSLDLITCIINMQHVAHNILLIRPAKFIFNPETASSNFFQNSLAGMSEDAIHNKAADEFEAVIQVLESKEIRTHVFDDTPLPSKPDAVFPNNWISFHPNGTVILYPMFAPNRRQERRSDIIDSLSKKFKIEEIIDLSVHEKDNKFLEGTGSIVFDHINKVAYACLSPRTDKILFLEICDLLNYTPVYFHAYDRNGNNIYHTNVMMCIAEKFAVVCLESITDEAEQESVVSAFTKSSRQIIEISFEQMNRFAGNMLEVKSANGKRFIILSKSAYDVLLPEQKGKIEEYAEFIPLTINTIETIGGGSARCMLAEVFLYPQKVNHPKLA